MKFRVFNKARISRKLTAVYALMFSLILVMLNASILFGIGHYLYSEADSDIEDMRSIILDMVPAENKKLDLSNNEIFSDMTSKEYIYVRIVKADGELINASANFPDNISELEYNIQSSDDKVKHIDDRERHFEYKSVGYNSQQYGTIYFQIVKDMKSEYDFMKMVFLLMIIADFIGVIASIMVGYIVSKKC